jgi:hypothetical protein
MKCKISGTWLSFLNFDECCSAEEIFLDSKEVSATFRGGIFSAEIDGEIDDRLVPYWGKSVVVFLEEDK